MSTISVYKMDNKMFFDKNEGFLSAPYSTCKVCVWTP